jgi:serine protease Do
MVLIATLFLFDSQLKPEVIYERSRKSVLTVETSTGTGTGFVSPDGEYLITCDHVLGDSSVAELTSNGKLVNRGFVCRRDGDSDLAILALEVPEKRGLRFATQETKVGQEAFAVGSSLGVLERSFTRGIISGIRTLNKIKVLQFDASVSPGNSGGPVLNLSGDVVGIVTSSVKSGQNINIATSVIHANSLLKTRDTGTSEKIRLGNYGRMRADAKILEAKDKDAKVYYQAKADQYLVVVDSDDQWCSILMANGSVGYVPKDDVDVLKTEYRVNARAGSVPDWFQLKASIPADGYQFCEPTTSVEKWCQNSLRFIQSIFLAGGRDISDNLKVQQKVGSPVRRLEHLLAGDRLFFWQTETSQRVAIYRGDGRYTSVTKAGTVVTGALDEEAQSQLVFVIRTTY